MAFREIGFFFLFNVIIFISSVWVARAGGREPGEAVFNEVSGLCTAAAVFTLRVAVLFLSLVLSSVTSGTKEKCIPAAAHFK